MEIFVTINHYFQSLTNVTKNSILNIVEVLDTPLKSNTLFLLLFNVLKYLQLFFQCRTEFCFYIALARLKILTPLFKPTLT